VSSTASEFDSIRANAQPIDRIPVTIDADALDTTTTPYLRELKRDLRADGLLPAEIAAATDFDVDCTRATQRTVDRIRALVDAAAFLGASTVSLTVDSVADESKVRPALNACAERARRAGIVLEVEGAVTLS
jgi:sugar phosphate isomerase/epimerase